MIILNFTENELKSIVRKAVNEALKDVAIDEPVEKSDTDTLLDIKQACEYLDCSKTTLYNYRRSGNLPYMQRGKKIFFRKSDLLKEVRIDRRFS
jgi:excisionase family DNA binding protein